MATYMKKSLIVSILVLLISAYCFAQDPVTIVDFSWHPDRQAARKGEVDTHGPVRMVADENKYFQRKAREQQTVVAVDPTEASIDGRSQQMEKNVQEARAAKVDDVNGYTYLANVKNSSDKPIAVVFWEYRFAELANPANVVRRQFLCSINLKPGDKKSLAVFSLLGPSDVIAAESLAKTTEKVFDEKVIVNRVEYADGTLRQRGNWKYDDYKQAIERVTSTPWGKEICRAF